MPVVCILGVTKIIFTAPLMNSEQVSRVLNTTPEKINFLGKCILSFGVKKFSIIDWLHRLCQEMLLVESPDY
jgi:hypothetical protein